jgi:serine/threonine protein kinase
MFEQLAQYTILDRIGAGGLGDVYRARDSRVGRTVAIKLIPNSLMTDPDRRERFLHHARLAAALSHPNIAALYEIGEDHGHHFLAFEYAPGESLHAAIGGRPLNPRRALDVGIQIADALADAHARGIVHRDLKPGAIIVTPKGRAKILDFGLSSWTAGGAVRERAAGRDAEGLRDGRLSGTIAYLSPEQALGDAVDHRTDIFSLGTVLFEMLTGAQPFSGSTAEALTKQILHAEAPAVSSVNPSLPRDIDAAVDRALAKNREARYDSAAALAADLRAIATILEARRAAGERAR